MKLEWRRVTVSTPGAEDARRRWHARESVLVILTDGQGRRGVGEASPLPGYSPDTLEAVEAALGALGLSGLEAALEQPTWPALEAVEALVPSALPSARMALATAALDWLGQRAGVPAPVLLGGAAHGTRPLAQLLGPAASPRLAEDADQAVRGGFRHVKLKLGARGELERELAGVQAVRERLGAQVSLRLDANGVLSETDLELVWPALSRIGIELFEEPGAVPARLLGALPLALDESLQGLDEAAAAALVRLRQAKGVILKPMALGGIARCWTLAARARGLGAEVVISHCFDGPFGWRAAAALALALPMGTAHGLAPHAGLAGWMAERSDDNALPVNAGWLGTWAEPGLGLPAELALP